VIIFYILLLKIKLYTQLLSPR